MLLAIKKEIIKSLANLQATGKLPADISKLDPTVFDTALYPIVAAFGTLHKSCEEAISGDWDKSDEGFEDMQLVIDNITDSANINRIFPRLKQPG